MSDGFDSAAPIGPVERDAPENVYRVRHADPDGERHPGENFEDHLQERPGKQPGPKPAGTRGGTEERVPRDEVHISGLAAELPAPGPAIPAGPSGARPGPEPAPPAESGESPPGIHIHIVA